MLMSKPLDRLLPYLLLAVLFAAGLAFRPLLPIDETRYLSVSWEMLLRGSYVVPTMNFAPYFQKPPMLFWLIDVVWAIVGVSRWSALLVIFAASAAAVHLTGRLAKALFPGGDALAQRLPWLMVGNLVFAIYASLILFDILLTVFVLAALLCYIAFARGGGMRLALLAGLFLGLGLLTKGPVVLLYAGWAAVLYPLWRDRQADIAAGRFFAGVLLSLVVMLVVGLAWLVPAIAQMGTDFAYSLVWKQAAGRVTGTLKAAHARPFYFYLVLFPLVFIPWIFSPHLWRYGLLARWREGPSDADRRALALLVFWSLGVLLSFSLISGKQPHYLVPILPAVTVVTAYFMAKVPLTAIRLGAVLTVAVLSVGQGIASKTAFRRYDLTPLADYVRQRQDVPWAFSGDYQAQITFLARLTKPLAVIDDDSEAEWSARHPDGYVIERFGKLPEGLESELSIPVEKGYLVVQPARSLLPKAE